MKIKDFCISLIDAILDFYEDHVKDISTFAETGLRTKDTGFLVKFEDGSEYQVTIIKLKGD